MRLVKLSLATMAESLSRHRRRTCRCRLSQSRIQCRRRHGGLQQKRHLESDAQQLQNAAKKAVHEPQNYSYYKRPVVNKEVLQAGEVKVKGELAFEEELLKWRDEVKVKGEPVKQEHGNFEIEEQELLEDWLRKGLKVKGSMPPFRRQS